MTTKGRLHHYSATAVLALALGGSPAIAQTDPSSSDTAASADSSKLPDIVVTAERRETKLRTTPVAVGVVSKDDIQARNIITLQGLAGSIPNLNLPKEYSPSTQFIVIRGIGTTQTGVNPAVALYVDDVYIPRSTGGSFLGSPDLAGIEVLRGPQGTLYGLSSSAGAVKVRTLTPSNTASAWASLEGGNYGQLVARAYATGPLIPDLLTASVAYSHEQNSGTLRNDYQDRYLDRLLIDQGRVKFHLTPGGGFDATLSIDGSHDHSDEEGYTVIPNMKPRVTNDSVDPAYYNRVFGVTLTMNQQINDRISLKSITAYRRIVDDPNPFSISAKPAKIFGSQVNTREKEVTQELQSNIDLGRLALTAGVIGYHDSYQVVRPSYTNNVFTGSNTDTVSNSIGAYLQGRYELTSRLGITVGGRVSRDHYNYDWISYKSDPSFTQGQTIASLSGLKQTSHTFTPKGIIDYKWSEKLYTYASVTAGEKSGGYNPTATTLIVAQVPLNPEKVTAFEGGLKHSAWGGRIQTNLAIFYNKYRDYQAPVTSPIINGAVVNGTVTVNAARAHTYGAEADTTILLAKGFTVRANVAYLKAKFDDFLNPTGAPGGNFTGNDLPYAPSFSGGGAIDYEKTFGSGNSVKFTFDGSYVGKSYQDTANLVPLPRHFVGDAGIFVTTARRHLTPFFTVSNIFNKTYTTYVVNIPSLRVNTATYNPPRTWRGGLRVDF